MYASSVQGQILTFDAEAVWRRNMIVRDRETGILWQQATGEALIGSLQGEQMELLSGERSTWGSWRKEKPDSLLVEGPEKWPGLFPLPFTETVLQRATRSGKVPGLTKTDRHLPQNEEIIGIEIAGEARAYPISLLRQKQIVNDLLGESAITLVYEPAARRVRAFERSVTDRPLQLQGELLMLSGGPSQWNLKGRSISEEVPGLPAIQTRRQWWSAWYEFHPGTTIYSTSEQFSSN